MMIWYDDMIWWHDQYEDIICAYDIAILYDRTIYKNMIWYDDMACV